MFPYEECFFKYAFSDYPAWLDLLSNLELVVRSPKKQNLSNYFCLKWLLGY